MTTSQRTTTIYTDGACLGNPGPGGWAWAIDSKRSRSGGEPRSTNQRMELSAVLNATKDNWGDLTIRSDSMYVVNCFKDGWWETWLKRNWRTSSNKPVANVDLWEPLIEEVTSRKIAIEWVKGHSGDPMNDLVDSLAVEQAKLFERLLGN